MAYTGGNTTNESADSRTQQSSQRLTSILSTSRKYNSYNPQEDYVFVPVTETDPWFTADYIEVLNTDGGEFFVKRNDGTVPTNAAETYVGPYFRWVRSPQYGDSARSNFGRMSDTVIGDSYYGLYGKGKPKNKGLRGNKILEALGEIMRTELGGPHFLPAATNDPSIVPTGNLADIKEASKQGIMLDQTAGAITLSDTGFTKYIHITDSVTLEDAAIILGQPNTDMNQLASINNKFGMKGRAPVITNQPNAKIDFGNEPLG